MSVVGGAIGAMHIPEKWFPGCMDYYLNSHNIMHVLVVLAVYSMHQVGHGEIFIGIKESDENFVSSRPRYRTWIGCRKRSALWAPQSHYKRPR